MFRLYLDTSGPYSTAAIAEEDEILGSSSIRGRPAAQLHDQIQRLLQHTSVDLSHVETIAIVIGPGSWTGLNIGVTAAKTLAQVLSAKVLPVSTFDALAAQHCWRAGRVCTLLGAGRGRVYRAWYHADAQGQAVLGKGNTAVIQLSELDEEISLGDTTPLLVEYDQGGAPLAQGHSTVRKTRRLLPESIMAAATVAQPLSAEHYLTLTPAYMQAALAERDAIR